MGETEVPNLIKFSYFDPFEIFDSIRDELEQRLPFQNLHWKPLNGSLRTISKLYVSLIAETDRIKDDLYQDKPLIMFLIVSCSSIDEYRSKVRPLVRQWLPPDVSAPQKFEIPTRRIILLHCNSEVLDSNIFKSVSLIEKLNKDFPESTMIEMKTIYKSEKERNEFWTGMINRLRHILMDTFQKRLTYLQSQIAEVPTEKFDELTCIQENILNLYLSFSLHEEASKELDNFRRNLISHVGSNLSLGNLEIPFVFSEAGLTERQNVIAKMMAEKNLTQFRLHKFLFIKQCELLQTNDPSTARYFRLYNLTRSFLKTIDYLFGNSPSLIEFNYYFIDTTLKSNLFSDESLNAVIEIRAELKIFQRDCWLNLAYNLTNYHLINKNFPIARDPPQSHLLTDTFKDEETFQQTYLSLTKSVLTLLAKCKTKKQRTVDLLSVEIAILYYQRKEYEDAISILQSCYEFYKGSNWSVIGNELLEYFVKCLIKCPNMKVLPLSGEEVPVSTILSNSILNLLTTAGDNKESWWDYFLAINNEDSGNLVYPLDNLFDISVNHQPFTTRENTFGIEMKVSNDVVHKNIEISAIQLLLKNHSDQFITLSSGPVTVKPGENFIILETTRIIFDTFEFVNVEVTVGNTFFCKEFCSLETEDTIEFQPLCDAKSFEIVISSSRILELTRNKIDVKHVNPDLISTFDMTLTILPDKGEITPKIALSADKKQFSTLISSSDVKCVEYFVIRQCDSFLIKQEINFNMKENPGTEFSQCKVVRIDCRLPISVSVEDIAKPDAFYFKFLINSSSRQEPVLLHKSSLTPILEQKYSISGGFEADCPILLKSDDEEACLNFFQIKTKAESKFKGHDMFHLVLTYNTLKHQLDHLVTSIFLTKGDISLSAKFKRYRNIWSTGILPKLTYDYDLFQQKLIIQLSMPKELLKRVLTQLHSQIHSDDVKQAFLNCLKLIEKGSKVSHLEIEGFTRDLSPYQLIVPVNLPCLQQLFSVEFILGEKGPIEIGRSFPLKIVISNLSYKWKEKDTKSYAYIFEITNDNEWLINGRRRAALTSQENQFHIQMIPLKRGYLRYPRVDIFAQKSRVSEVNHLNSNETILVT